ncbi:MAG: hypothetical protein KDI56_02075 [Xanthomonadales bacterium]|nr:hypothetical protein [Caldilinea sp.]MCB1587668.1 hypothetical protein [Xanthomonadales bacterium]
MASPRPLWQYDPRSRRYRDLRTGRYIGPDDLRELRDRFADALKQETDRLAQRLFDREITIQVWTLEMRRLIKNSFIAQYAAAVGGTQNMTAADYGRIGAMLSSQNTGQYWYLQRFAEAIAEGRLSEAQIRARAALYMGASVQAFERGKAASFGDLRLPALPGDGSTICLTNCRCEWLISETTTAWYCTWSLGAAEHCPDCLERAKMWQPYVVLKGMATLQALAAAVGGADGLRAGLEWPQWQG